MMVGALMKAFNVSWYDDRRLCHMEGCTPAMIGFKWDHAERDYLDPALRSPTLCCLSQHTSQQVPPADECTHPSQYTQVNTPLPQHVQKPKVTHAKQNGTKSERSGDQS